MCWPTTASPRHGETLTIEIDSDRHWDRSPSLATASHIVYTPVAGFTGTDTFNYHFRDEPGAMHVATLPSTYWSTFPAACPVSCSWMWTTTASTVSRFRTRWHDRHPDGNECPGRASGPGACHQCHRLLRVRGPGTRKYTLSESQPEFLLDGVDSIGTQGGTAGNDQLTIQLDQDTHGEDNNFGERGREAKRISITDFLSTTPRDGVLVASDSGNGATRWYAIEGGWTHAADLMVELKDESNTVRVDVEDNDSHMYYASVAYRDVQTIQPLSGANGTQLMRVVAAPSVLHPNAFVGEGDSAAEGEAAAHPARSGAEGEASGVVASSFQSSIIVQTDMATDTDDSGQLLLVPGTLDSNPEPNELAEAEAAAVVDSVASVDSVMVEIGFEQQAENHSADELAGLMQGEDDDFTASADEFFGDSLLTDEPL